MNFIILCLFTVLFSEEWVCSYSLKNFKDPDNQQVQRFNLERIIGNRFKDTSKYGINYYKILKETKTFIVLVKTHDYPSLSVIFLDKSDNSIHLNYLSSKKDTYSIPPKPSNGVCTVKY